MHDTGCESTAGGRKTNIYVYGDRWKREGSNRTKKEGCTETVAISKNTVGGGVVGRDPGDMRKDRCGETETGRSLKLKC